MCFEMESRFANFAIAAFLLAPIEHFNRRVHADPEDVEGSKQFAKFIGPALFLHDMIHDQVIAGIRKSRNGAMESIEESLTLGATLGRILSRPETLIGKLIR